MKDTADPADDHAIPAHQAEPHGERPSADPSWFIDAAKQDAPDSLIARYRRSRGLPDSPSRHENRPQARVTRYHNLMAVDRHGQPRFKNQRLADARQPSPRPSLKMTYLLVALAVIASGAAGGYAATRFDAIKKTVLAAVAAVSPGAAGTKADSGSQQPGGETVVAKKLVATATLQVSDVSGRVNSLIPLALKAEPATARQDLMLKISGLPDKAYLTSGHKQADQVWELTLAELRDVKLVVPKSSAAPKIDVAVAAFERSTGELAAPIKTMTIALADAQVVPAAAPPPQYMLPAPDKVAPGHPSAIPKPDKASVVVAAREQAAASLVSQGDTLLKAGDFAAARRLYEQAWASGAAAGAMAMGRSYDPLVQAQLQLRGGEPDSSKAIAWYERAAAAGETSAFSAIVRLKVKP